MKGFSTKGSGIDQVVSVLQYVQFLHLQRQSKRPEVYAKQKIQELLYSVPSHYNCQWICPIMQEQEDQQFENQDDTKIIISEFWFMYSSLCK